MNEVGTDIGRAWQQVQGTGTSTTVDMPLSKQGILLDAAEKRAAAAQKAAELKASMGKLGSVKPDWWYKHDEYLREEFGKVQEKGVKMIAEGKDPFVDIEFVKEWEGFQADVNISKDQKARFDTWNNEMGKAAINEYSDKSILAKNAYFELDIPTLRKTGIKEPPLAKNSSVDVFQKIGTTAVEMAKAQGIEDATPEQWDKNFDVYMSDPKHIQDITQSYDAVLQGYSEESVAKIDELYHGNRVGYYKDLAKNAWDAHRPGKEYSTQELLLKAKGLVGSYTNTYENTSGVTTSSQNLGAATKKGSRLAAEVIFHDSPAAYRDFVSDFGITGKDDKEIYAKAVQKFADMTYATLEKKSSTTRTNDSGSGKADLVQEAKDWLTRLRAGDFRGIAEINGGEWNNHKIIRVSRYVDNKTKLKVEYVDGKDPIYGNDKISSRDFDFNDPNDANALLEIYQGRKGGKESDAPVTNAFLEDFNVN